MGIGIKHLENSWNQVSRVSLESESDLESGFQSKLGIEIGIKTLPELCITDSRYLS